MKAKQSTKSGKVELEFDVRSEPRIADALFNTLRKLPDVKFKKILATTDFSDFSMAGVRYAIALAKELPAKLSLATVVEPSVTFAGFEGVLIARSDDEIVELEKKHLARLAKELANGPRSILQFVRYGKPFREIVTLARDEKFDLVVLATHGRTGLKRFLVGSTAEWVVRHAPCPVLTVPAQIATRKSGKSWTAGLRRILVPVDFSETSARALPYASELARALRAEVTLIHVTEPPPATEFAYPMSAEMEKQVRKSAEELLLRVQGEAFDEAIQTKAIVRSGAPYQEIVRAATLLKSDLIVLTTHGHTGFDRALIGSTAERVVRHSPCPVLVVRDQAQP